MKVKILTNLGWSEFPETPYYEGDEHDVDESLGVKLVARKLATDITPPNEPAPVVGVATEPELKAVPTEFQTSPKPHASAKPKKQGD